MLLLMLFSMTLQILHASYCNLSYYGCISSHKNVADDNFQCNFRLMSVVVVVAAAAGTD